MTPAFTLCCGVPARVAERGVAGVGLVGRSLQTALYRPTHNEREHHPLKWESNRAGASRRPGRGKVVDVARLACQGLAPNCWGGCDTRLAGETGASRLLVGCDKVSNFLLNTNIAVQDAVTASLLPGKSVDMRRNTQELGLRVRGDLVANRLLGPGAL
jgi:hypothetical protein